MTSVLMSLLAALDLPGDALAATIARDNGFVDTGSDADCGKRSPKIPASAAAVPRSIGDVGSARYTGRPVHQRQVPGRRSARPVIPGIYCAGESAGGLDSTCTVSVGAPCSDGWPVCPPQRRIRVGTPESVLAVLLRRRMPGSPWEKSGEMLARLPGRMLQRRQRRRISLLSADRLAS